MKKQKLVEKVLKTITNEQGQATLGFVLILTLIGMFLLPSLLSFIRTGIKSGQIIEERTLEYYAADSGIEDALWRIKNDKLPDWMRGNWGDATYNHEPYNYLLPIKINNKDVIVTIKPVWVLDDLETPSPGQGREPHDSLVTVGHVAKESPEGNGVYQIGIIYDGSVGNLKIERIGCWLPPGFSYIPGSSNLEKDPTKVYYSIPCLSNHKGGTAITWDYKPAIDYDKLPGAGIKKTVTFEFTPNEDIHGGFSWTRTNRNDIYLSWDVSLKVFKIVSKAVDPTSGKYTNITAYTSKKEFTKFGSAIEGDYQATGNTLMRDHNGDRYYRERLYKETSAIINNIPNDAKVEKIFLYWSGWKNNPWNVWNMSDDQRQALPTNYKVNQVTLQVEVSGVNFSSPQIITASASQVLPNGNINDPRGWSYSCYADITNIVTEFFRGRGINFVGNAKYSIGHWDVKPSPQDDWKYALYEWKDNHSNESIVGYTRYPLGSYLSRNDTGWDEWAYAAWSVIVIYSSPSTKGHQLYIYDEFRYCHNNQTLVFTVKGFLAPEDVGNDPQAARLTIFVGEGDEVYSNDYIQVNNVYLSDPPTNPQNNVWNSKSNLIGGVVIDGVDIDTYTVSGASGVIKPGDTETEVRLPTGTDSWNLIYLILSFRSEITTGGTISYCVEVGG